MGGWIAVLIYKTTDRTTRNRHSEAVYWQGMATGHCPSYDVDVVNA